MYAKSPRIVQSANSYFYRSKCTSMIRWFGVLMDFIIIKPLRSEFYFENIK